MNLIEGPKIKAASVYREHRGDRLNFVEMKLIVTDEPDEGHEKHLVRILKGHLGNMHFSYILIQVHRQMVDAYEKSLFFKIDYN